MGAALEAHQNPSFMNKVIRTFSTCLKNSTKRMAPNPKDEPIVKKTKSETKPKKSHEEVLSIRRKLEKMTEPNGKQTQALDLLKRLGEIDMSFDILKETMIGFAVHSLKKSSSDQKVISESKSLIKAWKKHVPNNNSNEKKEKSSSQNNPGNASSSKNSQTDSKSKPKAGTFIGSNGMYVYDGTVLFDDEQVRKRDGFTEPIPKKNSDGVLIFPDAKEFRPNMTPKEVLQAGSFGGTYFRPIKSSVTGLKYNKMWEELPQNWLEGLNVKKMISSTNYDEKVNTYKSKCGGSLEMWETSGWIKDIDPYGWFMWYCRFYLGRRSDDDERQIGRWKNCTGPKGRWKNNLIGKIARAGVAYDNRGISPVIRQTLQHWAYTLTEKDYKEGKKRVKM